MFDTSLKSLDDGRTPFGLHRDHFGAGAADPAERLKLVERLPHPDQAGAATGRVENRVGQGPAELFGQFQPHRFLALDPVRFFQRRNVEPVCRTLALPNDPPAIVDQAVDPPDLGTLGRHFADVHLGRIIRAEAKTLHAGPRRIGRHCRPGVAVGRYGNPGDAELVRHRHGHAQPARLERPGRQPSLVLHQHSSGLAQQRDQWRSDLTQRKRVYGVCDRQQLPISPQAAVPVLEGIARQIAPDSLKVVPRKQRPTDARQTLHHIGGITLPRHRTFEMGEVASPGHVASVASASRSSLRKG